MNDRLIGTIEKGRDVASARTARRKVLKAMQKTPPIKDDIGSLRILRFRLKRDGTGGAKRSLEQAGPIDALIAPRIYVRGEKGWALIGYGQDRRPEVQKMLARDENGNLIFMSYGGTGGTLPLVMKEDEKGIYFAEALGRVEAVTYSIDKYGQPKKVSDAPAKREPRKRRYDLKEVMDKVGSEFAAELESEKKWRAMVERYDREHPGEDMPCI